MKGQIYVGIDTSKDYVDVAVIDQLGQELMTTKRYSQDIEGYEKLHKNVEEISSMTCSIPLFGIESTGVYHVPLYDFLVSKGHQVRVFNGLEIRGLRQTRVRKTKTDKIDAKLIANALRFCYEPEKKSPLPNELRNLREFCRMRERLVTKRTRVKNQLTRNLDLISPGITNIFGNKLSKGFMDLLMHACTPNEIRKMSIEELKKFVLEDKAKKLKEVAEKTKGAVDIDKAIRFEIRSLVRLGRCILGEIKKVEQAIEKEFNRITNPIQSIHGVGPITGAVILTEIGDVNNFDEPKKIVAFAGLDTVVKDSGKSRKEYHISKRGSRSLRSALYQAAFVASRCNPVLKPYYAKMKSKGKGHRDAVVCCARKLCHIIYSVLKNNKAFYVPSYITSSKA